jgi:uncharacterized protein (DUF849 family)
VAARPILVEAALNGARDPGEHPALARTPDDIAREARGAVDAGAVALHMHPRGADGAESMHADVEAAWLSAVREAVRRIPIGVTTGAWIEPSQERRLALVRAWTVLPDFASVNMQEAGAVELCELLLERGIGIEPGVTDLDDTQTLLGSGLASRCERVLVEVEGHDADAAVEMAAAIDAEFLHGGLEVQIVHHGFGADTWAVIEAAIALGRDIRIGLEDTLTLPDGSTASGNADLVAAAIGLVRRLGREPAPFGA